MEWVVLENIRNLEVTNVDGQTRLKLRDHYRKILKDEKRAREYVEKGTKTIPELANISFKMMEKREETPEDTH